MSAAASGRPRAEPLYFGPADRPRLGWLHRPGPDAAWRDVGVVICNPFGYEALCAHRSLRHFAESAVSLGVPAMRFDYDGTGDSAGEDLDVDRWRAWRTSILDAIGELKRSTGVDRVCLVGVRLGALLAAVAAEDSESVAGLVLVAPVADGRLWLRETRALQAAMGRAEAPERFALPASVHESVGLLIDEATRESIAAAAIHTLSGRVPPAVLLIDRSDRPPLTRVVERLRERGAEVTHAVLPGFVEMTLDPHEAEVPEAMLATFRDWLRALPGGRASTPFTPSVARLTPDAVSVAPGVTETAIFLDEARRLFGIISAPAAAQPTRALVLLNAGANHHVGNGRMYVKFARRLAAKGWLVLRYDVSGIGDSLPHDGAPENEVYTPNAVPDLAAAVRFLRARYALDRVELAGLCSGAYHAFKGAVAALPVDGVLVINPLVFFWKPGTSLAYPPYRMAQAAAQYRRSMLELSKWLKLLRGRVDVRAIGRVVGHRVAGRARRALRGLARSVGLRIADDLAAELDAAVGRGIAVRFLFSMGDPGEDLLRDGAGSGLTRLVRRGAVSVENLDDCDHSLSCAWMHETLWNAIHRHLERQ